MKLFLRRMTRRKLWRYVLAGMALVLCLAAAGFALFPARVLQAGNENSVDSAGQLAQAAAATRVEGQLVPRHWVQISLPYGVRAERVLAAQGQRVAAGELLVQLDGHEAVAARAAAAELELVLARQAQQALYDQANGELARAEVSLALAQKEFEFRRYHLAGLKRRPSQLRIEQVHANLLLAERRLERAREDLDKARKKFANKKNIIWRFINQRYVRLALNGLEAQLAYHERRAVDAREKYKDVLAPVDPVLLAQAEAEARAAEELLSRAQTERERRLNGPDPDELAAAQARLTAAQAGLAAVETMLKSTELRAPLDGVVAVMDVKPGEWVLPGQRMALIADLSEWYIETNDLSEKQVVQVQTGEMVEVMLDAFPEQALSGHVESTARYYIEDDGDIYYTVKIHLDTQLEGMRWGMRGRILFPGIK